MSNGKRFDPDELDYWLGDTGSGGGNCPAVLKAPGGYVVQGKILDAARSPGSVRSPRRTTRAPARTRRRCGSRITSSGRSGLAIWDDHRDHRGRVRGAAPHDQSAARSGWKRWTRTRSTTSGRTSSGSSPARPGYATVADWLDQVAWQVRQGKQVSPGPDPRRAAQRLPAVDALGAALVRHARARTCGTCRAARAAALRLPLEVDWWLLDDERLILMYFTGAGEIAGKILTTDPGIVARHREWRDLAVRNATAAEEIAAA